MSREVLPSRDKRPDFRADQTGCENELFQLKLDSANQHTESSN